MNNLSIAVVGLTLLSGCAGTEPTLPADSALAPESPTAPLDAAQPIQANVQQVEVETFSEELKCRMQQPTGSRIAVKVCEMPISKAQEQLQDYVTRDEVDRMRRQQIYEEQARQAREAAERAGALTGPR